jgi:excisionase family DNA binding protein
MILLQRLYGFSIFPGVSYFTEPDVMAYNRFGRLKMEPSFRNSETKLDLLTAREAAQYLRVSLSTLNRMERRGLLKPLKTPGGHRRYTRDMLNECLTRENARVLVG